MEEDITKSITPISDKKETLKFVDGTTKYSVVNIITHNWGKKQAAECIQGDAVAEPYSGSLSCCTPISK